jgi:hypothetical protein
MTEDISPDSDHDGPGASSNCCGFRWGHLVLLLVGVAGSSALVWFVRNQDPQSAPIVRIEPVEARPLSKLEVADRDGRLEMLQIEDIIELEDPDADGWDTETASNTVAVQLKKLAKLLADPTKIDAEHQAEIAVENCLAEPLRPDGLVQVFSDACLRVLRPSPSADSDAEQLPLSEALRGLVEPFAGSTDLRTKFKVVRVEAAESIVKTMVFYEAVGRLDQGAIQQRAAWHCQWSRSADGELLLESVRVTDFEEAVNQQQRDQWFADYTESVLGNDPSYRQQLTHGIDHWKARVDDMAGIALEGMHGLAVGDVNGDGLEDVYLCQTGGVPNWLCLQQPDGTVRNIAPAANVDFLDKTMCALFVDVDNDGDQDLIAGVDWGVIVLSNDGQAVFTVEDRIPIGEEPYALSAIDFDNDRDLDFYVGTYYQGVQSHGLPTPIPHHDARNGGANLLIENEGNWRFSNVAMEVGLDHNNDRFSLAATWEDYDNDGDMDLYVANDFGRNNLYRNDAGTFVDVAAEAGVEDTAAGMSACWGDYNNDGLMDIYVGNMFSSAGNRITYQRKFQSAADDKILGLFQRQARGNTLFENTGDGTFRDVSESADVTMGRWSWGSVFVDLNNDGWQDIYVLNGFITQDDPDDL